MLKVKRGVARIEKRRPVMKSAEKLTIFSWGYYGWGNSIPQLLRATDSVERERGFEPPIFVDIRMNRAARAQGFRDHEFERRLGHVRYRWMRSLGNKNIGSNRRGIKINCNDAVHQLLDLAIDASKERRRIIFFCGCADPSSCHREVVSKLTLRAARVRGIRLQIVEWPGGQLNATEQLEIVVTKNVFRGLLRGTRKRIPIGRKYLTSALRLPWGTVVRIRCQSDSVPVSVGPAQYIAGQWSAEVFLTPVELDDSLGALMAPARKWRKNRGLDSRQV